MSLVDLGPTFDSGELLVKVTSKLILDMISRDRKSVV